MARNRVIYQSQALFIAPSSTGCQVSGKTQTTAPFGPVALTSKRKRKYTNCYNT